MTGNTFFYSNFGNIVYENLLMRSSLYSFDLDFKVVEISFILFPINSPKFTSPFIPESVP